ncbi:MAG: TetR/AcrR family transcriptional regulator [Clostridiales bacterium]|nr:TetR/AcrR family transcriptional regulator [Candidatus Cacconaster stercorequi]
MQKKLSEEKQGEILHCGISEFAAHGIEGTTMQSIASRAGISVGVLYKYHADKNAFFAACLHQSLQELEDFLRSMMSAADKPLNYARTMIRALLHYSREHGDTIRLYHRVTQSDDPALVREIECFTSRLYIDYITRMQSQGAMRQDMEPGLLAFFFDNLLMMMQFSRSCPYYQERLRLYAGADALENDDLLTQQLLKFMESAFTFSQADVPHRKEG